LLDLSIKKLKTLNILLLALVLLATQMGLNNEGTNSFGGGGGVFGQVSRELTKPFKL
jgi:hypothetical protein